MKELKKYLQRELQNIHAELNEIKKSAQSFGELMYGPDTKVGQTLGNTAVLPPPVQPIHWDTL